MYKSRVRTRRAFSTRAAKRGRPPRNLRMLVNVPEMKTVNPPKQFSAIGRDAKGFCFLCYGSDWTLRGDRNKALSAVNVPKLIEISDVHSR